MKSVAEQCSCCGGDIILVGDIVVLKPDATYAIGETVFGPAFSAEKEEEHKRPILVTSGSVFDVAGGYKIILNGAWSSNEFLSFGIDNVIKIGSVWDLPWPEPVSEKGGSEYGHV